MPYSTAEETQVIGESTSSLSRGKFAILTKFLSQVRYLFLRVLGCRSIIICIGFFVVVVVVVIAVIIIV